MSRRHHTHPEESRTPPWDRPGDRHPAASPNVVRRHLRFGWWSLLCFLTLGLSLELMHGFKLDIYLNAANETRRLLWTLAHAHGTLLSILNVVFALSIRATASASAPSLAIASRCLIGATLLLPLGFFSGGIFIFAGDPGLPVLLVPLGALLLFIAVLLTARAAGAKAAS